MPSKARIVGILVGTFLGITGFQNCSNLESPSGDYSSSSSQLGKVEDLEITSSPSIINLTEGDALNFEIEAESSHNLPISYAWTKGGQVLGTFLSPTFQIPSTKLADAGIYKCVISTDLESKEIEVEVQVDPSPTIKITTQPKALTLRSGLGGTLSVVASIATGQTINYQWYKNGAAIGGATAASLAIPSTGLTRAANYYVVLKTTTAPIKTVQSNTVKVTVTDKLDVNNHTGCVNGFCSCFSSPGVASSSAALAICKHKGYATLKTFATAAGRDNDDQCNADGSSCFENDDEPEKLICDNVTCSK